MENVLSIQSYQSYGSTRVQIIRYVTLTTLMPTLHGQIPLKYSPTMQIRKVPIEDYSTKRRQLHTALITKNTRTIC